MAKILILKEVNAISNCGMTIIVKQIFEKILNEDKKCLNWKPLPKIVIADKLIYLNEKNSFTHPKLKEVFQIVQGGDMFKFKKKTKHFY